MVSDAKRKEIEKEAKRLLEVFSKELSKVKVPADIAEEVEEGFREEGKGDGGVIDRELMMENAPNSDEDFIVAEKKNWS